MDNDFFFLSRLIPVGLGLGIAAGLTHNTAALADPAGFSGNYAGAAISPEQMTSGLAANLSQTVLGEALLPLATAATAAAAQQYQGRLDLPNSALSVRGSVYLEDRAAALVPTVTYDVPIQDGINLYAGAGYALTAGGRTPLGDRSGWVLSTGAETEMLPGMVVYGNAQVGIGTDSVTRNSPLRLQVGVGRRF